MPIHALCHADQTWTRPARRTRFGLGLALLSLGATVFAQPGTVWTWGSNSRGMLATGSSAPAFSATPLRSIVPAGTVAVSAGYTFAVALNADGTVWGWGSNFYGQLGIGTSWYGTPHYTPVAAQINGVSAVNAGYATTLALRPTPGSGLALYGWGSTMNGQLGYFSNSQVKTPKFLSSSFGPCILDQSTGAVMALLPNGTLLAWGDNTHGILGNGGTTSSEIPSPVPGLPPVANVACGWHFAAASGTDGSVWCWGYNTSGQVGPGAAENQTVPFRIPNLAGVVDVAAGGRHTLALHADGTVWAWGHNGFGQLGDGTTTDSPSPVQVVGLSEAVDVVAGNDCSFALLADGTVRSWGYNYEGRLGDGSTVNRSTPVPVLLPVPVKTIDSMGGESVVALEGEPIFAARGTVVLSSFQGDVGGQRVDIELRLPGTSTVVERHGVRLGRNGTFVAPLGRTGTFDLALKASHWLRSKVSNVEVGPTGVAGLDLALANGDVTGDNSVNLADFLALRSAFGSTPGTANWNSQADLDGNGAVGVSDFLVLRGTFGRQGV